MKIVIIDDEIEALYLFLEKIIGIADIEYKFYRDDLFGIVSYVSKEDVRAAFLDICMPRINGIELAEKLIQILPTIKIVFVTGLAINEDVLPKFVRDHTVGFLYKPYDSTAFGRLISRIKEDKPILIARMFDTFDCYVGQKKVEFSSVKSKELFALLLAYNGKTLTMNDAISQLWPDRDLEKSKILYRDAVWRLKRTLKEIGIPCLSSRRAELSLDKGQIECDYWNYLLTGEGDYRGEFLKSYDWSIYYLAELDDIQIKSAVKES